MTALPQKFAFFQANGAGLGWLRIPHSQAVDVWPSTAVPQQLEQLEVLEATPEFPGLQLQLAGIWAG